MVCRFLESCSGAQEMLAHLHLSYLQKPGWDASQTQLLAVTGGEFANPPLKNLEAVHQSHQRGETHFTGKEEIQAPERGVGRTVRDVEQKTGAKSSSACNQGCGPSDNSQT